MNYVTNFTTGAGFFLLYRMLVNNEAAVTTSELGSLGANQGVVKTKSLSYPCGSPLFSLLVGEYYFQGQASGYLEKTASLFTHAIFYFQGQASGHWHEVFSGTGINLLGQASTRTSRIGPNISVFRPEG